MATRSMAARPVAARSRSHALPHPDAGEALRRVKDLARTDPAFAEAFRLAESPQQASELAHRYGIDVSPAALWRKRGTLTHGGLPTWRG